MCGYWCVCCCVCDVREGQAMQKRGGWCRLKEKQVHIGKLKDECGDDIRFLEGDLDTVL